MLAVFGRRRRLLSVWAWTIIFAATFGGPAQADTLTVNIDEARIMKLPDRVATIVIGNPLIADATLQSGGILVITGKGYGTTNLMALDRTGRVITENTVQVRGPVRDNLVVVYKGVARESYSCTPECAPRATLGDDTKYFTDILGQTGTRTGQAQSPASK